MMLLEDRIFARLDVNFLFALYGVRKRKKSCTTAAAALPPFHVHGKTEQTERQATAYRCSGGRQAKYDEGENGIIPNAHLSGGMEAVAAAVAVVLCI